MANQIDEKTKEILEKNIKKALLETDKVSGGGAVNAIYEQVTGEKPGALIETVDGLAHTFVGYILGGMVQSKRLGDTWNPFAGESAGPV